MAIIPMAVFGLEVPAGGVPIAAKADIPAAVSFGLRLSKKKKILEAY